MVGTATGVVTEITPRNTDSSLPVNRLGFASDGSVMLVNFYDDKTNNGKLFAYRNIGKTWSATQIDTCSGICFPVLSPGGGYVVESGRVFDTRTGRPIPNLVRPKNAGGAIDDEDRHLLFLTIDVKKNVTTAELFDLKTQKRLFKTDIADGVAAPLDSPKGLWREMSAAHFSRDGSGIVLLQRMDFTNTEHRLVFLDARTGAVVQSLEFADEPTLIPLDDLKRFAINTNNGELMVYGSTDP